MSSRKEFEAWYLDAWGCTEDNLDSLFEESPHGNEYYRFGVRLAWQAWQQATKKDEAKCAALAAENAALNKFIKDDCWIWDDKSEEYFDAADCMPETQATDAFLAEVRAQGVEMAACALDDVNQFNYANMLDDLAQKIRQEAAQ
ncbi:hypothetical protein KIP80_22940 [Citrobacter braakii]|nr:hypothetical protein [Citrobacter braakii]